MMRARQPSRSLDRRLVPALLGWYDLGKRDLPWRRQPSAYRTLISEIMLQQTGVSTVIPYFDRFCRRFPDVAALASAAEDEVLEAWSGLGYYRRARNLHRTAQVITDAHGGEIPRDEAALRALPGVGAYTAAAVAAIAYGRRAFALDGNAARVVARLAGETAIIDRPATRSRLHAIGLTLVPADRPGDFAQAVMELGALLCTPTSPKCEACPVAAFCQARALGCVDVIPARQGRRAVPRMDVVCLRLERAGQVLLARRQEGLLAGTWTLPLAEVPPGATPAVMARALKRTFSASERLASLGTVRHLFTHRDVTAHVFGAAWQAQPGGHEADLPLPELKAVPGGTRWCSPEGPFGVGVSTFTRKTLQASRG